MKRDFISIDGLKNVLSPKEMKNVLGGSGDGGCDSGLCWVRCKNGSGGCTNNCAKACEPYGGIEVENGEPVCWC